MAWLEITIPTPAGQVAAAAAALTAQGFSDLVLEDQGELESFLEENRDYWDYIDETLARQLEGLSQIRLYLEDTDADSMARLETLLQNLSLSLEVKALPETDWATSWQENYPPQPIGRSIVVLPCWQADLETDRRKVILDPGLTFGTGAHPSTQMVIAAMEDVIQPGFRCLDLGSGSGILSIAALALGAGSTVGVDVDPKAQDIAAENAGYNPYAQGKCTFCTANVLTEPEKMDALARTPYDLVLVNIVADVIIALAPVLPRFLKKGSPAICSGILEARLPEVKAALAQAGLEITAVWQTEQWCCLQAEKVLPEKESVL